MRQAIEATDARINEFTVAPQTAPENGLPYHEWFVEFAKRPTDMDKFCSTLDKALQKQNSYYFDLIDGKILQQLKITPVAKDGFQNYMKSLGKLGGQNKVQRLSNDRKVADKLTAFKLE